MFAARQLIRTIPRVSLRPTISNQNVVKRFISQSPRSFGAGSCK